MKTIASLFTIVHHLWHKFDSSHCVLLSRDFHLPNLNPFLSLIFEFKDIISAEGAGTFVRVSA